MAQVDSMSHSVLHVITCIMQMSPAALRLQFAHTFYMQVAAESGLK